MDKEKLKITLQKFRLLTAARKIIYAKSFFKDIFCYFLGLISGGRFFANEYWRHKQKFMNYQDPMLFWREWGDIYIFDRERRKIGKEHEILMDKIDYVKPNRILEAGCGYGLNLKTIKERYSVSDVVGLDFSPTMLEHAKKYLKDCPVSLLLRADVCAGLPIKDSIYDLTFTHGLLMHIRPEYIDFALDELIRVTKKYIINMEIVVNVDKHPKVIERDIGRFSYNYAEEYRRRGLNVIFNESVGHQVVMVEKPNGI